MKNIGKIPLDKTEANIYNKVQKDMWNNIYNCIEKNIKPKGNPMFKIWNNVGEILWTNVGANIFLNIYDNIPLSQNTKTYITNQILNQQ